MKAHVGVDSRTKLIHTILASAANVHDREALPHLLHCNETRVWGDQGYQGQTAAIRGCAPRARDFTNRRYRYSGGVNEIEKARNRTKSRVRAKVEHPSGVIKRIFGFSKGPLPRSRQESAPPRSDRRARQPPYGPTTVAECVGEGVAADRRVARFEAKELESSAEGRTPILPAPKRASTTAIIVSSSDFP